MESNGDASHPARRRGRPPKLSREQSQALVEIARRNPMLSLDDMVAEFRRQTGMTVSTPTVRKHLSVAGISFRRLGRRRPRGAATAEAGTGIVAPQPAPRKYGYREAHRDAGDLVRYPCGLTDSEWEQVKHLFDPERKTGRPPQYPRRQVLDGCVYVMRSGCPWRLLPKDFPKWTDVYKTFRRWVARGLFETMFDELRELWRSRQHRAPEPTAAVLDSQSVKTSPQGGPKGYDAGKKVKGRKRHLVVDTLGLLLAVVITAASVQDRDAARPALDLALAKAPGIAKVYLDAGYAGETAQGIVTHYRIEAEVVRRPANEKTGRWQEGQILLETPKGFVVLPKRWVIERTNGWTDRARRLNKDHDRRLDVSAAWIWLNHGRMLLRRIVTEGVVLT